MRPTSNTETMFGWRSRIEFARLLQEADGAEPLHLARFALHAGVEPLERDELAEIRVPGLIDPADAALPELLDDDVLPEPARGNVDGEADLERQRLAADDDDGVVHDVELRLRLGENERPLAPDAAVEDGVVADRDVDAELADGAEADLGLLLAERLGSPGRR
jgi:hypothetical protein